MEKKVFEHLLSKDPIGAFEKIKEDYIRYFEDAYKISNQALNKERIELLKKDDNLYKEPYIELLPEYNPAKIGSIDELAEQDSYQEAFGGKEKAQQFFSTFIKEGLMNYIPYGHQVGMLEKAFVEKKNVVITSGTGSGKTEAFLLPLFAQLFKEASSWEQANLTANWFQNEKGKRYAPRQREGEKRQPALRALIMYPMNALVEDQMTRLRKALDNPTIRKFFDDELNGNRIFFGSYNGSTIGSKSHQLIQNYNKKVCSRKEKEVYQKLSEIHDRYQSIGQYIETHPDKKEALYTCPRLDGKRATSEMITRWDMQEWAPDIMITNVSMLSIMLMRKAESTIFEQTKKWLENRDNIFHIIIDELHLYRGTSGSEVACLIGVLLNSI